MSIGLSAAELASMRAEVLYLMPDTCAILSATSAADGYGGYTVTWGTATASIACRIDSVRKSENQAGAALQPFHGYVLTLPYNATITTDNRVVYGGDTYNVLSVDSDKSWPVSVRCMVELV